MPRRTLYGEPIPVPPRSAQSVLLVDPVAGFSLNEPETDLAPGQTPDCVNFMMKEGALQLRPALSAYTANENPVGPVTGGAPIITSVGSFYTLVSGATQLAYYSAGSWSSPLSYVSSNGVDAPPSGDSTDFTDIIQVYAPSSDEMVALVGWQSYQTLQVWEPDTDIFSTVTDAPRARYIATFDNFVLALNVKDDNPSAESRYVQRVQWSDRGDPLQWDATVANSLAGFEDLLDAKGQGTRLITADNRIIVFFEDEVWQGYRTTGASSFAFSAIDRTIGSPYPWTVTKTPLGIFFLGRDLMVYLLAKGSSTATPVGFPVQRRLRERIDNPSRAWGVWDADNGLYLLWHPVKGGTGFAQEAVYLNMGENSWAPQSVVHNDGEFSLARGFTAYNAVLETAITWADLQATGETWASIASTFGDMDGSSDFAGRVLAVGDSSGTIGYFSRATTDLGVGIGAYWRSQSLGADSPNATKALQEVRVDYQSGSEATIAVRASRDQGATFDNAVSVTLAQSQQQNTAVAHVYTHAQYPTFQVNINSRAAKLYRFWATMRIGGR